MKMTDKFLMSLDEIQPSQLYINREKLARVMEILESRDKDTPEPIPIKDLNGEMVSTDGHTRALAWYLKGHSEVEVEWEDAELDWEAYEICVAWCKHEGILSIADLEDRIIGSSEYQTLWLDRCRRMQEALAAKRDRASEKPSS